MSLYPKRRVQTPVLVWGHTFACPVYKSGGIWHMYVGISYPVYYYGIIDSLAIDPNDGSEAVQLCRYDVFIREECGRGIGPPLDHLVPIMSTFYMRERDRIIVVHQKQE